MYRLACLFLVCVIALPPLAAHAAPLAAAATNAQAVQTPTIAITPHRALYEMVLSSAKNGGTVSDVSGHMLFEWRDVCDGWAIQQHLQLHFVYAQGDEQDISSTELTWESKDGKRYNFNIHRMTDGKETEAYRGKAMLNDDGSGTVSYSLPEVKTVDLPVGTIFPSTHTLQILHNAVSGEKLFTRRVFDGADSDGSSDISAFILQPKAVALESGLSTKLKDKVLLSQSAWPVRMAFYKIGSETGEPDYEMNLDLLPNGIASHMQIDYGDFVVNGNLEELDQLPAPSCS